MVFASSIFHLPLEASTPPFVPTKEPVNLSTTSDLILRSPSEARASRRMAASPNLLPWFETARYARLLTMRPSVLELAPKSPKVHRLLRGDDRVESLLHISFRGNERRLAQAVRTSIHPCERLADLPIIPKGAMMVLRAWSRSGTPGSRQKRRKRWPQASS